jgi:hypothetical protein
MAEIETKARVLKAMNFSAGKQKFPEEEDGEE